MVYSPNLGSDGWTDLSLPVGDKQVFVDATSGSDSNDGLSEGSPKQTIAAGYALLTDGTGDQLLLKCGEVWSETLTWDKSGRSSTERMVFGSYGTGDRPSIQPSATCISTSTGFEHVIFVDLELKATGAAVGDGNGIRLLNRSRDVVIEGCSLSLWRVGVNIQGIYEGLSGLIKHEDVTFRRCVVFDQHSTNGSNAEGIYLAGISGLTIEECILDSNGWLTDREAPVTSATIFNHNAYIQYDCEDVTVSKLWTSNAASTAITFRPLTGDIKDSTFYRNPIGMYHGNTNASATGTGFQRRNVIVDGANINSSTERGWAFGYDGVENVESVYNLAIHQETGTGFGPRSWSVGTGEIGVTGGILLKKCIWYKWGGNFECASGVTDVNFADLDIYLIDNAPVITNTYDNNVGSASGIRYYTSAADGSRFEHEDSTVTDASWKSSWGDTTSTFSNFSGTYNDPEKKMEDYASSIGMSGGTEEILSSIRLQRKGNWDLNLTSDYINTYFRGNFGMLPAPQDLTGTVSATEVSLSWEGAPEDDSYVVERSADTSSWSVATSVSATSATDIPGSGDWYYRVTPVVNSTSGDVSDNFLAESVTGGTTNTATADITLPSLGITASAEVSASPGQTERTATATITLPSLGIVASGINVKLPGIPSSINVYLDFPNINIDWGAATSAVSYTVEMDLASSGYSELSSGITSPLSATVAYPGVGTQRFRVYATNPNGDGGTIEGFLYTAPVTPSFMGTGRGFLGKSLLELKLSF